VSGASLTRWAAADPPGREALDALLRSEDLEPRWWSSGPSDRFSAHSHTYHKVLYCAEGSIRFTLPPDQVFDLAPGDRLDLPPNTSHSAVVGPSGVTCVEAARRS
jgi:hypothetical protein